MNIDWASLVVHDVAQMPTRATKPPRRRIIEATCANCDASYGGPRCSRSAFCSARCRDQAKYVRYVRAGRRQYGDDLPADIRDAIHMKRIHALGAGYDDSARRISPAQRRDIWERDGGRCVECGHPADEIDHRDGPSDDPVNLALLCRACHREKTVSRVSRMQNPSQLADAWNLRSRETAAVVRACDSADWAVNRWEWHRSHVTYAD